MTVGLTLEHFFILAGVFLGAVALQVAANSAHPRRWGSAAFWAILAVVIGAGRALPAELVGWLVITLGGLVAAKQVTAPAFADEGQGEARAAALGRTSGSCLAPRLARRCRRRRPAACTTRRPTRVP